MASEFDHVHSVQRALEVGALHRIIPPANLRPYLIDAVERGMAREEESSKREVQGAGEPIPTMVSVAPSGDADATAGSAWSIAAAGSRRA
jgi:hypothetical protein